jgi:hypothetical protein
LNADTAEVETMSSPHSKPLVEALPTPAQVRRRLADAMNEVKLLRRLLELSLEAARCRKPGGERLTEVSHA